MTEKEILSIVETLKYSRNKIEVFMDHKKLTCDTIESASQRVKLWKSLIQEFGVTLIYIKVETNVADNDFSRLPMGHRAHKLADTTLEENTCELMCLHSLFISGNTDCFSLDIEGI